MALLPLLLLAAATDRPASEAGVAVVQVSMAVGHMTPLHTHPTDEALAVLTGTLTIHVDAALYAIGGCTTALRDSQALEVRALS